MKTSNQTPKPGLPVRGSTTGKPIMVLLDLLGRKQALRILWELREETLRFRDLQARAETSPSVLNTRLRELRDAGLVELLDQGYRLTGLGRGLSGHLMPLVAWADDWAASVEETDN